MADAKILIDTVKQEVSDLIAHYKGLTEDKKLSLGDVWKLSTSAVAGFMRIAEEAGNYDGSVKKAAVLQFAEQFYDDVVAPLDIPYVPGVIENRLVDPGLKRVFLELVNGSIESLVNVFNRTGWFDVVSGVNGGNGGIAGDALPNGFVPY